MFTRIFLRIFSIFLQRHWFKEFTDPKNWFIFLFFFFEFIDEKRKVSNSSFSISKKHLLLSNQSLNCKNNQCLYCYEFFFTQFDFLFSWDVFCNWMDWEFYDSSRINFVHLLSGLTLFKISHILYMQQSSKKISSPNKFIIIFPSNMNMS